MTPKRMIVLCNDLLELLDMLEGVIGAAESENKRDDLALLYKCIRETRELNHIARKETGTRMTKTQVQHINGLMVAVDKLVDNWPSEKLY